MVEHPDIHPAPDDQSEVDKVDGLAEAPVTALGLSSTAADTFAGARRQERSRAGGEQVRPTGPGHRPPDGRAATTVKYWRRWCAGPEPVVHGPYRWEVGCGSRPSGP